MGIKSSEKSAKNVFLHSHEYRVEKIWGKKSAKQFFRKHSNNASNKCWEKIVGKKYENPFFLYSHEYRDQKMGGQNERNNFSRNTRIVRTKNGKNIV